MKKILSIGLALGLVLGLMIVAAPALADVSEPQVTPSNDAAGEEAAYTIVFDITETLSAGSHDIVVDFPAGTGVPGSFANGDISVEGTDVDAGDVSVSGNVVTITTPVEILAAATVDVVFKLVADIVNPTVGGAYTLFVNTSRAGDDTPVESAEYDIIPAISTYKFVVDFSGLYTGMAEGCVPPLEVDVQTACNLATKTDVLGAAGYAKVRVKFTLDSAPADATLTLILYDGAYHTFILEEGDSDYWGPEDGFSLAANYTATTPATVECDTAGDYTVTWAVVDMEDDEAVVPSPKTVTATVWDDFEAKAIVLDDGWNLMSLPLIPLDSAIGPMLCGLDVVSVWHYDAKGIQDWLTYIPDVGGTLATMVDGKAYWIDKPATSPTDTLWIFGSVMALPPALPPTYDVVVGWNMVGFKSIEVDITAATYLYDTDYVRIYGFDIGGWFVIDDPDHAADGLMVPGLGYWVAFSAAGTIYP